MFILNNDLSIILLVIILNNCSSTTLRIALSYILINMYSCQEQASYGGRLIGY